MNHEREASVELADASEYADVRAVIVRGLTERWGNYNPSYNPDLEAFGEHYAQAVVLVAKVNDKVVGCGTLIREQNGVGRIVRMSVIKNMRRSGIGTKILHNLLESANRLGYKEVVLETATSWQSAIDFYRSRGFEATKIENGDQHFRIEPPRPNPALQRTASGRR